MRPMTRWFQGHRLHGDHRRVSWTEPGTGLGLCLALVCEEDAEGAAVARITASLFPERICECYPTLLWCALIHFNNHRDTTRDHIDKILHTYELEQGT